MNQATRRAPAFGPAPASEPAQAPVPLAPAPPAAPSVMAEIGTLLWLQARLTLGMLRSRRHASAWANVGRSLLLLALLAAGMPFFAVVALGLAWLMGRISAQAAVELAILANVGLLFLWLLTPGVYNSSLVERIDLPRLAVYPVSLQGLIGGSALVSLSSLTGLGTALVLAGEIAGLASHGLWTLPSVLLGAVPTFLILLLAGRLVDDVFDMLAGDRRLRGLLIFLMLLPLIGLFAGFYYLEYLAILAGGMDHFLDPLLRWLGGSADLQALRGLSASQVIDVLLLRLRPSRHLMWLPVAWGTAAMGLPAVGRALAGLAFLALSGAFAAGLAWAHAAILQRMARGVVLHAGSERVRNACVTLALPGPPAFGALVAKDWINLRRSPLTRQTLVGTPVVAVVLGLSLGQMVNFLPAGHAVRQTLPWLAATILVVSTNLVMINHTANYFGGIDREGFTSLLLAPVSAHYILLSAGLVTLTLMLGLSGALVALAALASRTWGLLPWGLYLALCLHASTLPGYMLVGILSPFRAELAVATTKSQGNLWMVLAWVIGSTPVVVLLLAPVLSLRPSLGLVTLPLAGCYSLAFYLLTLHPLSLLLQARAFQVREVVSKPD